MNKVALLSAGGVIGAVLVGTWIKTRRIQDSISLPKPHYFSPFPPNEAGMLRVGIQSEFDAINLYDHIASKTSNPNISKVLKDISKEEKEHVGELQTLLLWVDREQIGALLRGKDEVRALVESGGENTPTA